MFPIVDVIFRSRPKAVTYCNSNSIFSILSYLSDSYSSLTLLSVESAMFVIGSESVDLLRIGPSLKKSGRDLWTLASPTDGRSSCVISFTLGLESEKGNGKSNGNPVKKMSLIFTFCRNIIVYFLKHEMHARYLYVQSEEGRTQFR